MKKTKIIAAIIAVIMGAFGLNTILVNNHAYAAPVKTACDASVPDAVKEASGCNGESSDDLRNVIVNILDGIIGVLALVAVIFIIVGGVNYMTSTGEAVKIQKAKNTILYAVIGLIICILAFAIVNFVVNNILQGGGGPSN